MQMTFYFGHNLRLLFDPWTINSPSGKTMILHTCTYHSIKGLMMTFRLLTNTIIVLAHTNILQLKLLVSLPYKYSIEVGTLLE